MAALEGNPAPPPPRHSTPHARTRARATTCYLNPSPCRLIPRPCTMLSAQEARRGPHSATSKGSRVDSCPFFYEVRSFEKWCMVPSRTHAHTAASCTPHNAHQRARTHAHTSEHAWRYAAGVLPAVYVELVQAAVRVDRCRRRRQVGLSHELIAAHLLSLAAGCV